jgi:hypothetical protein
MAEQQTIEMISQESNNQSTNPSGEPEKKVQEPVKYSMSGGFLPQLGTSKISIALTSYQSSRLYLLGVNPKGGLMVNEQLFQRAMGLRYHDKKLYLASLGQILELENILAPGQWINEQYTQCFVPRRSFFTGHLDCHDVGITKDNKTIFVNTLYNCIAELSNLHSFKTFWKPSFITKIVAEDRCHLNGMAMEDGKPRYVTAVCRSDTVDGWRDRRADGGVVIDVEKNEIVCEGLSMPHSPRLHQGKLWVLNSGSGELGSVDLETKQFKPLVFCPGFLRGLAFVGDLAFVGLSRPRYERFEGLALDKKLKDADSEPWTGIQVININTGACVHWFRMDGPVLEVFDVEVLPGIMCAKSVQFASPEAQALITIEA